MAQPFLLLNEADVRRVLTLDALLPALAETLSRFSAGELVQPQRSVLAVGPAASFFGVMPAYSPAPPALGAKLVTVVHANAARGLPSHLATVLLLDPDTGALLALLDGRYITELRTAAVSALSVRHLAAGPVRTLALLGAGVQAQSHLHALSHLGPLEEVRVWSPRQESRERFARAHAAAAAPGRMRAVDSAEEAVQGAQAVVLATAATEPVLQDAWVAPGAHVVSVGACRPAERELDPVLLARSRLFVDSRTAALAESGDVVQGLREGRFGPAHLRAELGEVIGGRAPGRQSAEEVTVFKSLGLAVEDLCAAQLAYRLARERGLGQALAL
ncbi:ornithine cyclodeaminase family protein [Aggregicoccus sp. 17bor-14]|uniref:ornithine cyclodeaminase family protein n=1 Tax=Myxococcaceae TaxID=31 RepID=UPI00129C81EF|nr:MULTISPECIES: ornithine cyclodeaminase family protein [Myxococcaceae]MBF5043077.1 ornithine cyclodeaminase family protein [Simulacricoccus sp. 17bor-14]MRI88840.1 ornithine cyclodeaminase family protein [Aggregicoccus sp. 17bor-14]